MDLNLLDSQSFDRIYGSVGGAETQEKEIDILGVLQNIIFWGRTKV